MNIIALSKILNTSDGKGSDINILSFIPLETRKFGKPLTNTYRNQDYINHLKKKGKLLDNIQEQSKENYFKKNYIKNSYLEDSSNIIIDESRYNEIICARNDTFNGKLQKKFSVPEELTCLNNIQHAVEYINEITIEFKKGEVFKKNLIDNKHPRLRIYEESY